MLCPRPARLGPIRRSRPSPRVACTPQNHRCTTTATSDLVPTALQYHKHTTAGTALCCPTTCCCAQTLSASQQRAVPLRRPRRPGPPKLFGPSLRQRLLGEFVKQVFFCFFFRVQRRKHLHNSPSLQASPWQSPSATGPPTS